MIIYNGGNLDRNSRFILCIFLGLAASIGLGIVYGAVQSVIHIEIEYVYIFLGYLIGEMLQKLGHGVTMKYSVLGAVLAIICIVTGDFVSVFGNQVWAALGSVSAWRMLVMMRFGSLWAILGLVFRVLTVVTAYRTSRIF